MTHAELMARMSTAEFAEWCGFLKWREKEREKAMKKSEKGRR